MKNRKSKNKKVDFSSKKVLNIALLDNSYYDNLSLHLNVSSRGVLVKVLLCDPEGRQLKFNSFYYVHLRNDNPWKKHESHYRTSYGLNSITTLLLPPWLI